MQREFHLKIWGTERIVYGLTEGLVKRGTRLFFASGDSLTSAKLISIYPKSLRSSKFENVYGLNLLTLLHIGCAADGRRTGARVGAPGHDPPVRSTADAGERRAGPGPSAAAIPTVRASAGGSASVRIPAAMSHESELPLGAGGKRRATDDLRDLPPIGSPRARMARCQEIAHPSSQRSTRSSATGSRRSSRRSTASGWPGSAAAARSSRSRLPWAAGDPPPRPGCQLTVLIDGADAFGRIAEAIGQARESIHITGWHIAPSFELVRGREPLVLGEALAAAAERLDVRVLVWAGSPVPLFHPSRKEVKAAVETLTRGTRIRAQADPREHPLHCHHEKTIVIDGRARVRRWHRHDRSRRRSLRRLRPPGAPAARLARRRQPSCAVRWWRTSPPTSTCAGAS